MRYAEINKIFTNKVNEYLNKGYIINSSTMSGSQGEVAKIDLTNGNEIIRIMIDECWENHHVYNGYEIIVGKAINAKDKINSYGSFKTIWSEDLIKVYSEKFYHADHHKYKNWFVTKEEAKNNFKIREERIKMRRCSFKPLPDKAKDIALKYVRKQPKCSRARKESIQIDKSNNKYHIYYRNYSWVLK